MKLLTIQHKGVKNNMNKKIAFIIALILAASLVTTCYALDTTKNMTVNITDFNFTVPQTDNYTLDKTPTDAGETWEYYDAKNNLTIYLCDDPCDEFSLTENWTEALGYNQKVYAGGKTVAVCSDYEENLQFVIQNFESPKLSEE